MADILPQIKVTDSPSKDDLYMIQDGRPETGSYSEVRSTPNGWTPNKLIRNLSSSHLTAAVNQSSVGTDGTKDSQTAIDPLSRHILKRTHTENMIPQKLRVGTSPEADPDAPEGVASASGARNGLDPAAARGDGVNNPVKEKKKGVSFLSRFIGSKKKDQPPDSRDDGSEPGDNRQEGTDADLFSQPIGFIPRFPAPPRYIKVRSHGKKEKDFNRVFLAQELRGRTGVEIAQSGGRLTRHASVDPIQAAKDGNAVWALEFSKDGKYLAAGGQDNMVRIWAVISTAEERQTHEKEEDATVKDGEGMRLNAPVFKTRTVQEYEGHTASVLDLSWSKNNFLLSSSMDKTVRLWHVSRTECLCCFKHSDFVTSIQFHPRDDRFFLAGSLDSKLRLWSIPDKSVAFWNQLPDLITAVAFAPDGKTAIAGCLNGMCSFYETEGLKYNTQIHVRSSHGRNAKGSKITGIQAMNFPPGDPNGDVKLLITSNDSRVRLYNLRDKGLEVKFRGNENTCSQIHASFSDDARYVICGSEDRKAYIWSTGPAEKEKDKRPVEIFEAHSAIVTTAIMAPTTTKQLLGSSGDPLYDLCNPPPVTLVSRTESPNSSKPATENEIPQVEGNVPATPATASFSRSTKAGESPAYIARSAHPNGNVIVTADYMGNIKVFRQDCAFKKRRNDSWDTSSTFSKKILGRSNSGATRHSNRSRRDSLTSPNPNLHPNPPSSERILSWRNSIASNVSLDNLRPHPGANGHSNANGYGLPRHRSASPRKSLGPYSSSQQNNNLHRAPRNGTALLTNPARPSISTSTTTTTTATSPPASFHMPSSENVAGPDSQRALQQSHPIQQQQQQLQQRLTPHHPPRPDPSSDPPVLHGDSSNAYYTKPVSEPQTHPSTSSPIPALLTPHLPADDADDGGNIGRQGSAVSALSSEEGSVGGEGEGEEVGAKCRRCGRGAFRAKAGTGAGAGVGGRLSGLGLGFGFGFGGGGSGGGGEKARVECVRCGLVAG